MFFEFAIMEKEKGVISRSAKMVNYWKERKMLVTAIVVHHLEEDRGDTQKKKRKKKID